MICPFCANEITRVVTTIKGLETLRVRRCPKCGRLWQTSERVVVKDAEVAALKEFESATKKASERGLFD